MKWYIYNGKNKYKNIRKKEDINIIVIKEIIIHNKKYRLNKIINIKIKNIKKIENLIV